MNPSGRCPPCPQIGCFKDGYHHVGVTPAPCLPTDVAYTEGRTVRDVVGKDCLASNSFPGCECFNFAEASQLPKNQTFHQNSGAMTEEEKMETPVPVNEIKARIDHKKADESLFPPCYLPQPNDELLVRERRIDSSGEQVNHQTDRRLMHQRVTAADWRMSNRNLLSRTCNTLAHMKKNENDCKNTMARAYAIIDKTQAASTQSVRDRSNLVTKWKCTIERAIAAMIQEITALGEERLRLKQSLVVLGMPYSIATECLQRRCTRPESERIYDQPEAEMHKELELIERIRKLLNATLADVEAQQDQNRQHRQLLEMDWSDKKVSNEIETLNVSLNNHSTIVLFHAGATRFPADQSSEEYWEHFSKNILEGAEKCRQKSVALRGTLNGILMNAARDLRSQADAVELAFTARIGCMEEVEKRLTSELKDCLQKLADTENLIVKMTRGILSLDCGMKVAQTRLDNRSHRPNVENCRDKTQHCLVEEVEIIHNGMSAMKAAADEAENTKRMLMDARTELEKEIMLKRRTILMDRERCMLIRSHFPSATQLTGYAKV